MESTLVSSDTKAAETMPGVVVVRYSGDGGPERLQTPEGVCVRETVSALRRDPHLVFTDGSPRHD